MTDLTITEKTALAEHEAVIARGLKTFVDVGAALLAIRDGKLYRREYWTFDEYCEKRWGFSNRRANQFIEAATTIANLGTIVPNFAAPTAESQVRPLTSLPPEQQATAWQRAVDTAPEGRITAAHVQAVVDDMRQTHATPRNIPEADDDNKAESELEEFMVEQAKAANKAGFVVDIPEHKPHVAKPENLHVSDDSYEWYTPAEYIAAARRVMGSIHTDPASCAKANAVIQADTFYTVADNGLAQPWPGNVWLNPPYNMPWIEAFVDRALAEYAADPTRSLMVLTNNSTDTAWFHKLLSSAPVCLTRGRIRFWGPQGETLATRQGQAIFYLGSHENAFRVEFSAFGAVVRR